MNEERKKLLEAAKPHNKIALIADDTFSDVLESKIKQFEEVLARPVEIDNLDELLEHLKSLKTVHEEVELLKEAISSFDFPETVTIKGLDALTKVMESFPKETKIINKINNSNVIDEYQITNIDEEDDLNSYYGFLHMTGKWYVLWISGGITSAAFKYRTGANEYLKGWSGRKKGAYSRFDEVSL